MGTAQVTSETNCCLVVWYRRRRNDSLESPARLAVQKKLEKAGTAVSSTRNSKVDKTPDEFR
jgi:hypothetical protein